MDYNKLPKEESVYVKLPIKYIGTHVPRVGLSHIAKLKIPYNEHLFEYYNECFKKRISISIRNYASCSWTQLKVKSIIANIDEIILELEEEI